MLLFGKEMSVMAFCSKCGGQLNAGSSFCPACGAAVAESVAPPPSVSAVPAGSATLPVSAGMTNNVAGMLCYILGIVTGVIFLVLEPYKNNRFVRFHAFQSIFFSVACYVFLVVWSRILIGMFLSGGGLPVLGLFGVTYTLIRLAMFVGWIFLMIKAYNNEEFKLPIIGDLAAKQAGA
jgi:uncharacterized membrane protein